MTRENGFAKIARGASRSARRVLALARKELLSCLSAPAFYGAAVFFLAFCAVWLFYFGNFFAMNVATMRPYFAVFPLAFVIVVPMITMRSWAEERKTGSAELLLTMPFSEWNLALGKFLSAYALLVMMLALTIPVPLTLFPLGDFDVGVIVAEYFGALLLGASAVALGILLSALSKNQAGAFLGTAAALLATLLVGQLAFSLSLPHWLSEIVSFFSLPFHFESFSRGVLDSRAVAYYVLSAALFLFLTTRVILYRKWS